MVGHNLCFYVKLWKIIPKLSLLPLLIWSTGSSDELFSMPDQNQTAQKILMLATSYVLMEESNNELYHQSDIEDLT